MRPVAAITTLSAPGAFARGAFDGRAGRRRRAGAARGFTLLEASLAIMIVGVAFVSVMELFAACTRENQLAARITTAQLLAANVQEMTASLPLKDPFYAATNFGPEPGESAQDYNDLDDFDGESFNPPFDSTRAAVGDLKQYTQLIHVMHVDPDATGQNTNHDAPTIPPANFTGAMRLRVIILYRASPNQPQQEVLRTSWIRLDN